MNNIKMTPIFSLLTNYIDENNYDLLQVIAESHISIHKKGKLVEIDVFSCKDFNEKALLKLIENNESNIKIVNRGIYFDINQKAI